MVEVQSLSDPIYHPQNGWVPFVLKVVLSSNNQSLSSEGISEVKNPLGPNHDLGALSSTQFEIASLLIAFDTEVCGNPNPSDCPNWPWPFPRFLKGLQAPVLQIVQGRALYGRMPVKTETFREL